MKNNSAYFENSAVTPQKYSLDQSLSKGNVSSPFSDSLIQPVGGRSIEHKGSLISLNRISKDPFGNEISGISRIAEMTTSLDSLERDTEEFGSVTRIQLDYNKD